MVRRATRPSTTAVSRALLWAAGDLVRRLVDEKAVSQISRRGQGDQANQARDHEREQHFNQGESARHATRWHEAEVLPSSL
jgi:hypothetical protein